jgi:hypothetical protein
MPRLTVTPTRPAATCEGTAKPTRARPLWNRLPWIADWKDDRLRSRARFSI